MSGLMSNILGALGRVVQSTAKQGVIVTQNRYIAKHWNPKFKRLRKEKVIKIKLPNFQEKTDDLTPEEHRSKLKEKGLLPARPWIERPLFISCTGGVFEPYVPPEGDGKFSAITTTGAKQKVEFMTKKGKGYMAVRKIKTFEEGFTLLDFEDEAQQIYLKAHEFIGKKSEEDLRMYVTERAYPEVRHNTEDKTIHWSFVESLEKPRVVHARTTHVITKDNVFAQITVRFHNQQILAVYDRFGRLMHGSEIVKKDVLEYVVFEKHLANHYGTWRLHAKIIPPWMPPREFAQRTLVVKPEEEPQKPEPTTATTTTVVTPSSKTENAPALA